MGRINRKAQHQVTKKNFIFQRMGPRSWIIYCNTVEDLQAIVSRIINNPNDLFWTVGVCGLIEWSYGGVAGKWLLLMTQCMPDFLRDDSFEKPFYLLMMFRMMLPMERYTRHDTSRRRKCQPQVLPYSSSYTSECKNKRTETLYQSG